MLSIKTPTLLLNSDICRENIRTMAAKAREHQVIFRPHFKSHQSAVIGEWFRAEGVTSICVSSVSMAKYFAEYGWKDITIAFPVNMHEIDEINVLASQINLNVLIESEETALFLSERMTSVCSFFVKIDTGYHRTGIDASNILLIDRILLSADISKLKFRGFLTHSGNAYHTANKQELVWIQQNAADQLLILKNQYQDRYPDIIVSVGDTPTCSQLPPIKGIDEIRPGNFVFFDVMQFGLGSCSLSDIAVALICPVVAVHTDRQEAVIYGGAIHLSKEHTSLPPYSEAIYGMAVRWNGIDWNTIDLLGTVKALSQEHGVLSLTNQGLQLKPGDFVAILPVHSCLTANLMRRYYTLEGDEIRTINS